MKLKPWMTIKVMVSFISGLGFLLAPAAALQVLGTSTDAAGLALARFFGATIFLVGLALWMTRSLDHGFYHRSLASAILVGDALATIVAVRETLSGTINGIGWGIAGIYLVFTLAFGYGFLRIAEPVNLP
jgi:hypothetical protein